MKYATFVICCPVGCCIISVLAAELKSEVDLYVEQFIHLSFIHNYYGLYMPHATVIFGTVIIYCGVLFV